MKVTAKAPGTCGEFIQGIFGGVPCLVSSPVDLYSTTTIEPGSGAMALGEKGRRGLDLFIESFGLDPAVKGVLNVQTSSEIPMLRGMASSTADLCSLFGALGAYFGVDVDAAQMARMCVEIEPSDNLMFRDLNLFNHYTGEVLEDFGGSLSGRVLAFELDEAVDTVAFGYATEFLKSEKAFRECVDLMRLGVKRRDLPLVGEATTLSARLNQNALPKPYLDEAIALALDCGGYGVMIGHSGSALGVLAPPHMDAARLKEGFEAMLPKGFIVGVRELNLIQGGVEVDRVS